MADSPTPRTPQNESLLLLSIRHQLEAVVDQLCELGSDLSLADKNGNSPLWVALRSRQEMVATKLVRGRGRRRGVGGGGKL